MKRYHIHMETIEKSVPHLFRYFSKDIYSQFKNEKKIIFCLKCTVACASKIMVFLLQQPISNIVYSILWHISLSSPPYFSTNRYWQSCRSFVIKGTVNNMHNKTDSTHRRPMKTAGCLTTSVNLLIYS